MDSSSLSHTTWKCQYHIVFIPKYRRKIMYGNMKADVREILKKLCEYMKVEIVEGAVCADHVHLCITISIINCLICDFCPSDQRFAAHLLQIPPHDGHPCAWLCVSYYKGTLGTFTRKNSPMLGEPKKDTFLNFFRKVP